MSDVPATPLDMRAILAKIDRDLAETDKLFAEAVKLRAEGQKFNRDFWLIPLAIIGAMVVGIMARLPEILRVFGVGP
jgi:uncharacterized protein YegJ (DUF2314 family)